MQQVGNDPSRPFRVLVVSDNQDLVELLTFVLERAGFAVLAGVDVPTVLKHARHEELDVALLDLDLSSANGRTVLTELRRYSRIPIMVISAKSSEEDKIDAFESGADDYLTKPLSHGELIARLRARMRRGLRSLGAAEPQANELTAGPLMLSVPEHVVNVYGQPVSLTVTEFRVLYYLMLNAGHVVPTRTLARHVWGWNSPQASNLQRVAIHRLRHKLEADPHRPRLLHTIPGVGVVLNVERH